MKLRYLRLTLCTLIFTTSSLGFAQKIKVTKVKGNQAVVEFSGSRLQAGQTYDLNSSLLPDVISSLRKNVISVSASLLNVKADTALAETQTNISLSGKYGWNMGSFEFGPVGSFESNGSQSTTQSSFKMGGFGDYNMISNTPGEVFIYGLGGYAELGQYTASSGAKSDLMEFFAGPFVKWFINGGPFGFRVDGGYLYQGLSGGGLGSRTVTGLAANLGIMVYF